MLANNFPDLRESNNIPIEVIRGGRSRKSFCTHAGPCTSAQLMAQLKQLCSKFALFFINKIVSLKQTVSATLASLNASYLCDPIHKGEAFESIATVSADEVRKLITSMPSKSSSVNFIPTSLLKHCPFCFFGNNCKSLKFVVFWGCFPI